MCSSSSFCKDVIIQNENLYPQAFTKGDQAFAAGAFTEAIDHWLKAITIFEVAGDERNQFETLIRLGSAYHALGHNKMALTVLTKADQLAEKSSDHIQLIRAKTSLGAAMSSSRQFEKAEQSLQEALDLALENREEEKTAQIYNNIGELEFAQRRFEKAKSSFEKSVSLAKRTNNQLLLAKTLTNLGSASAKIETTKRDNPFSVIGEAIRAVEKLPPSHDRATLLTTCGQSIFLLLQKCNHDCEKLSDTAYYVYQQAYRVADQLGDSRSISFALGYKGQLYELENQHSDAFNTTQRAVYYAQQSQSIDALYQWEWQTARILKVTGDISGSIAAYQRAIKSIESIRADLALTSCACSGSDSFRESVGAVYYELADLFLLQSELLKDPKQIQQTLNRAQETIEEFKSIELQDYFQDECFQLHQTKSAHVADISTDTALIYIIPLADRTELIVSYSSEIKKFTVPVKRETLTFEINQFRRDLEKRTTFEFLGRAQQIYNWLIRPLAKNLESRKITTLIFVLDGPVRTIPLTALHDGHKFLIENYAVVISPGITLMEPRPIGQTKPKILLSGLSQSVQGYSALEYVPDEMRRIRTSFQGEELMDETFLLDRFQKEINQGQFSMIHIASHGEFRGEASKSYLLTYDSQLRFDNLESLIKPGQFRGQPLELLTLSACQTAIGDDRAALGLGGIAVKAGARSALATLWNVNDQATAILIGHFYSELANSKNITRAQALRNSQLKLILDPRYKHACYWSPFILIGNWL